MMQPTVKKGWKLFSELHAVWTRDLHDSPVCIDLPRLAGRIVVEVYDTSEEEKWIRRKALGHLVESSDHNPERTERLNESTTTQDEAPPTPRDSTPSHKRSHKHHHTHSPESPTTVEGDALDSPRSRRAKGKTRHHRSTKNPETGDQEVDNAEPLSPIKIELAHNPTEETNLSASPSTPVKREVPQIQLSTPTGNTPQCTQPATPLRNQIPVLPVNLSCSTESPAPHLRKHTKSPSVMVSSTSFIERSSSTPVPSENDSGALSDSEAHNVVCNTSLESEHIPPTPRAVTSTVSAAATPEDQAKANFFEIRDVIVSVADWLEQKTVLESVVHFFADVEASGKIKQSNYVVSDLFFNVLGESSKTVRLFKAIHQNIIFVGVYALRTQLTGLPLTKDFRGKEGWRVRVIFANNIVTVRHTRRELSCDAKNKFWFEWCLTMTFDSAMLDMHSASLRVSSLVFETPMQDHVKQYVKQILCNGSLMLH
ncbi:hypothetical protein Pelo_3357 [Pelomyxa schiedti]|nr:hypothetical protein Pelo_3357 [Pelomyxa schiedti]